MEAAASVSRIARALAAEPQFIVLRRAVSALDVSIRRQILNLLQDIQEQRGLSYI
jgi:ABC-type oligopeptide transport system ATPase subunit